jgi:protein-disulfide isomerase
MKESLGVVAVALLAFTLGWFVGRSDGSGSDERIAALEERLDQLGAGRPTAAAQPPAEAKVQKIDIDGSPVIGPADAKVTIVEFADFQCPYCLRANPTVDKILADYPKEVRRVFKHFPLSFHQQAMNAHRATLAAKEQGKFWEMHDLVFKSPQSLDEATMKAHAKTLGLDLAKFEKDYASDKVKEVIDRDIKQGQTVGVRGTPAFFINGRLLSGAQPYEAFKARIDEELKAS